VANLTHEKLIMTKLMIGKIMFKPTTIKVIMGKLMIIKLITTQQTKKKKKKKKKKK
jgi:hypothetical protein